MAWTRRMLSGQVLASYRPRDRVRQVLLDDWVTEDAVVAPTASRTGDGCSRSRSCPPCCSRRPAARASGAARAPGRGQAGNATGAGRTRVAGARRAAPACDAPPLTGGSGPPSCLPAAPPAAATPSRDVLEPQAASNITHERPAAWGLATTWHSHTSLPVNSASVRRFYIEPRFRSALESR
jgi:hypothetical protein